MDDKIRPICQHGIMYNSIAKTYRDGSKQIICATSRIFREPGWEVRRSTSMDQSPFYASEAAFWAEQKGDDGPLWDPEADDGFGGELQICELGVGVLEGMEAEEQARKQDLLLRSLRRARVKVRDYCLSTDMKWFATFTLDKERIDRYDVPAITKKLNRWLDNQVRRRGLAYVMVPEFHQDGAVHFHGMMTDALRAVDSGTVIPNGEDRPRMPRSDGQRRAWIRNGGRIVYNLPDWPYGFTTALQVTGCYEKAVNYICKYISKGISGVSTDPSVQPVKVGGRWYYSGGKLGKPGVEFYNSDLDKLRDALGDCCHPVDLSRGLPGVEMAVVWITPEGVPR